MFPGFMLIGSDVKLNSASSLIGQALAEILQYPDKARDALRVLLHLVRLQLSVCMCGGVCVFVYMCVWVCVCLYAHVHMCVFVSARVCLPNTVSHLLRSA